MKKSNSSSEDWRSSDSRSAWQRVTTVGIDVGDRVSRWCALDDDGEVVAEEKIAASVMVFDGIGPKRFAIETGTSYPIALSTTSSVRPRHREACRRGLRSVTSTSPRWPASGRSRPWLTCLPSTTHTLPSKPECPCLALADAFTSRLG